MFNAKSNDIWCLGVCLFMMTVGSNPWNMASTTDAAFNYIMNENDKNSLIELLYQWNKLDFVDEQIIVLIQSIFKYENKRCDLNDIKQCSWLLNK